MFHNNFGLVVGMMTWSIFTPKEHFKGTQGELSSIYEPYVHQLEKGVEKMKRVVKNSIEWTIITIALCILVVVLAAATKGIVTNSSHHSFFQMISDSLPKDNSLIRKGTPSQSIVSSSLGILTILLIYVGMFSIHILLKTMIGL